MECSRAASAASPRPTSAIEVAAAGEEASGPDVLNRTASELSDVGSVRIDWENQSTCTSWTDAEDVHYTEVSVNIQPIVGEAVVPAIANPGRDRILPQMAEQAGKHLPPAWAGSWEAPAAVLGREHMLRERLRSIPRERHRQAARALGRSEEEDGWWRSRRGRRSQELTDLVSRNGTSSFARARETGRSLSSSPRRSPMRSLTAALYRSEEEDGWSRSRRGIRSQEWPDLVSENGTSSFARARETGRSLPTSGPSPHIETMEQLGVTHAQGNDCQGAFPPIEENDHLEPAHTVETLSRVLAHYNTLAVDNGQIGEMLKANNVGLDNVPIASLVFSSRPLTALSTRWQIFLVVFVYGIYLLVLAFNLLVGTLSGSAGMPMRWLKVDTIRAYENVFPDLSSNNAAAGNGLLNMVDGGVFVNSHNLRHLDGCSTNITSPSSFSISCSRTVHMHGIWLLVTGSSRKDASVWGGGEGGASYDYAGVQYSYEVGQSAESAGIRFPEETEVFNVMGTGQSLRGTDWQVIKTETKSEGLFRIETANIPLTWANWKGLVDFVVYFGTGSTLVASSVAGYLGKPKVAKFFFCSSTVVIAVGIFAVSIADFVFVIGSKPEKRDLVRVLYGLSLDAGGMRFDKSCNPAVRNCVSIYGLETADYLASIYFLYSFVWIWWSFHLCRERLLPAFCVWIPMLTIEIVLVMISPVAGQQMGEGLSVYVAAVTGAMQIAWHILRLAIARRIAMIMSADQTFYDKWWNAFSSDPSNRLHLKALRHQVVLVNDSIREASQDAAMLAATHRLARSPPPSSLALEEGGDAGWRPQGSSGLQKWMRMLRWTCSSGCGWSGQGAPAAPAVGVEGSDVVRQLVKKPPALVDSADFYLQASKGRAVVPGHSNGHSYAVPNVGLAILWPNRQLSQRRDMSGRRVSVARSIDTLFQQAACLRPILQQKMEAYVGTIPHACRIGGSLQTPLKVPTRAVEKTQRVYGGDCSRLLDICRECLVFDVLEDLVAMLDRLRQDPEIEIVRIKNRLDPNYNSSTLSAGYRDVMVNIQVRNSETMSLNIEFHIAEIQLIPRAVYERRTSGTFSGHVNYVLWRDLRGK